jgi:hypothetical protein
MEYFEDGSRIFEFSVVSEAQSDDYAIECFDMSADGPGLVGVLRVAPNGSASLALRAEVTTRLLRRWLALAEREAGLAPSEE